VACFINKIIKQKSVQVECDLEKRRLDKTTGWQVLSVRWIPPDVTLKCSANCPHCIYGSCVDLTADPIGRVV